MSSCNNYFGKIFAHLAAALAISAISAETSDVGVTMYGNASQLMQFFGNILIFFGLLYGVNVTKPGSIPKYAFFVGLAFWIGQVIKPYVVRLEDKGALTQVLVMTTGVFTGMMALGFYDSMNMLGFGPYLLAGLIGLIIARLAVAALGTPEEKTQGAEWLRMFAVALFAIFTAYDIQVLRRGAKHCEMIQKKQKMGPDYPAMSLGIYFDFINLFLNLGGDE
jgi:FtsH-binding integral membrane protein